jgi:hypothetical protein
MTSAMMAVPAPAAAPYGPYSQAGQAAQDQYLETPPPAGGTNAATSAPHPVSGTGRGTPAGDGSSAPAAGRRPAATSAPPRAGSPVESNGDGLPFSDDLSLSLFVMLGAALLAGGMFLRAGERLWRRRAPSARRS